jgi:AraC-like DNA-binding protein
MSVLIDEDNVLKIKKAKEIIIANMAEPPGLQELADEIGLNLKKLKMGFKQIYGDTVYGFYLITKWISPENYLTVDLIM